MSEAGGRATGDSTGTLGAVEVHGVEAGGEARPVAATLASVVLPSPSRQASPLASPFSGSVDSHVHVFPEEVIKDRDAYLVRDEWFRHLYRSPEARMVAADEAVSHMDEAGVETSVVFGFAFRDQGLCRLVNDYVVEAANRYPGRLAGLACVSPEAPGAAEELERCLDLGLRGCGELMPDGQGFGSTWTGGTGTSGGGSGQPGRRKAGGLAALAHCLEERHLPLLLHSNEPVGHHYPGKGDFTPGACFALARAYPTLTIVFAHMGGGLFLYELMPEVRKALANVYYDTSAVPYLYGPEVYEVAVACAGAGKILFGSDYPLLSPGRYKEGLARLAHADRAGVLAGNARKVFSL